MTALLQHCPECSAIHTASVGRCWLCGADLPAAKENVAPASAASAEVPTARTFSLSTLFLVMTLAAVAAGAFAAAPGLGVLFLVVATPALIRTIRITTRQNVAGVSSTPVEKIVRFLASIGIVLLVILSIQVALGLACWAGIATGAAFSLFGEMAAIVGGVSGGFAALTFIGWILIRTWRRRNKQ